MQRRAIELVMAVGLGALGATVVLSAPVPLRPGARAPVCEGTGAASAVVAEEVVPALSPWEPVEALGYVAVGPVARGDVAVGHPAAFELLLEPDPRACHEPVDGHCAAGCFEIMAAAADGTAGPLRVEVSPLGDSSDVIASSLRPSRVGTAGFCHGFAVGHAGQMRVQARVTTEAGEGPIEVAAWRHPDPEGGSDQAPRLTLRLPRVGSPLSEVLAHHPECAAAWDEEQASCRFHGSVGNLPLDRICEDGCAWWTYRFAAGRLHAVVLERSIADIDEQTFGDFADEAMLIAGELDRVLGRSVPEDLGRWAEVEADDADGERVVLQRRAWQRDGSTTWELAGWPGHHPVAELRIEMRDRSAERRAGQRRESGSSQR